MKKATLNLFLLLLVTLVILPSALGLKCYEHDQQIEIDDKDYKKNPTKDCTKPKQPNAAQACYKAIKGNLVIRECRDGVWETKCTKVKGVEECYCNTDGCNGDAGKGKSNTGGALVIPSLGTLLLISVPAFFLY